MYLLLKKKEKKKKIELLMVTFNSYLIIIWIKIPPNVIFRHLSKIMGPLGMVFNSENLGLTSVSPAKLQRFPNSIEDLEETVPIMPCPVHLQLIGI